MSWFRCWQSKIKPVTQVYPSEYIFKSTIFMYLSWAIFFPSIPIRPQVNYKLLESIPPVESFLHVTWNVMSLLLPGSDDNHVVGLRLQNNPSRHRRSHKSGPVTEQHGRNWGVRDKGTDFIPRVHGSKYLSTKPTNIPAKLQLHFSADSDSKTQPAHNVSFSVLPNGSICSFCY